MSNKQLLLDEIKQQIEASPSFVVAQYQNLTANKANEFRRELRKIGGSFEVLRKRLFIKAAQELGIIIDLDSLTGHVGLVLAPTDVLAAAKAVMQFSDGNEKALKLVAGRIEGEVVDGASALALSQLPSKEALRSQFLGLLEAPLAGLIGVLEASITPVLFCLEQKANPPSNP